MDSIVTRGSLPHWYMPGAAHFVTFRLFDSLPKFVRDRLNNHRAKLLSQEPKPSQSAFEHRLQAHKLLFAEYDKFLDRHPDNQCLLDERIATLVRDALYFWNARKYELLAYCIMPNHVHVLFRPFESDQTIVPEEPSVGEVDDAGSPLSSIMHSLKSYTAHKANKILGKSGAFWQRESYDHWVRDDEELARIVVYINANPVKCGLVLHAHEWKWCSAYDRFLRDGDKSGWLRL